MLTKEIPNTNYKSFWNWFERNAESLFNNIKNQRNLEDCFNDISEKLGAVNSQLNCVIGLSNDVLELIITPDGIIKNIVFVEELIEAAPTLSNWKFTALKQGGNMENMNLKISGYQFKHEKLSFYPVNHPNYPDEVDITIVYDDFDEKGKSSISNGVSIFLDNYLGELNFITTIDNINVIDKEMATEELIPISKLKSFLKWREKEFIEKYNETNRSNTYHDNHTCFEGELENGQGLIAIANTDLLQWDGKASHPWLLTIKIDYNGKENGMPDNETLELLNSFEDELMLELKDSEGYLNIGRQTGGNYREIYFACKEFRKSSKSVAQLQRKYSNRLVMSYSILKDKYWISLERFS